MKCPFCERDYRDPPAGKVNGYYYAGDNHFYKDQRRFGMQCSGCGKIAEFITKATGRLYRKREQDDPDKTLTLKFKEIEEVEIIEKVWTPPV